MRLSREFIQLAVKNYMSITEGQNRQVAKFIAENMTPQERYRISQNALKIYHAARGN